MTQPRPMNPQERARLEQMKRAWDQKRQITQRLGKIGTKIAVYSGKGGVGKTTVAVNLAALLADKGKKVGLLDSDIDCPNVTKALGVSNHPEVQEGVLIPAEAFGIKVVSTAFFQQKEDEAIIWRGPMVHNAINQFLQMTDWGELDYLVTDLPPGTGDAPLTIMQTLPLEGFVVVTTPQALAKLDAKRSINMIKKLNVPVLGVVENFTGEIFGTGAGKELAQELDIPFLGTLSMRADYRDTSKPTVLTSAAVRAEYEVVLAAMEQRLEELRKVKV